MRLRSLWLAGYKNLRDVAITFSADHAVSVVVGHNGTGKSNLLEALTEIFRDLDLGEPPTLQYRLIYECKGQVVEIEADPAAKQRLQARVDGKRISQARLRGEAGSRYLPDFVFGYYSGPSTRLQRHFEKHREIFNRALREGGQRPLRRLFYAQPAHSQFVLLAFFLDDDPSVSKFLRDYLRIDALESVLFVLREPPWSSSRGDPRFWNARGVVAELLGQLYSLVLAPMRRIDLTLSKSLRREHLYLYLEGIDVVRELAGHYGNKSQELFKAFESILAADLLSEVRERFVFVCAHTALMGPLCSVS